MAWIFSQMHRPLLKCDYSLGIYRVPAPLAAGANMCIHSTITINVEHMFSSLDTFRWRTVSWSWDQWHKIMHGCCVAQVTCVPIWEQTQANSTIFRKSKLRSWFPKSEMHLIMHHTLGGLTVVFSFKGYPWFKRWYQGCLQMFCQCVELVEWCGSKPWPGWYSE